MVLRIDGRGVARLRINGLDVTRVRLDGKDVLETGLRSLVDTFDTLASGTWRVRSDPASRPALPVVAAGELRGGTPGGLWSGKPTQSAWTRVEADNDLGVWEAEVGAGGRAGLVSGLILACDDQAEAMTAVEFNSEQVSIVTRASAANAMSVLASRKVAVMAGDKVRAVRSSVAGVRVLEVFLNGTRMLSLNDRLPLPSATKQKFVGVRVQSDRDIFGTIISPPLRSFSFTGGVAPTA